MTKPSKRLLLATSALLGALAWAAIGGAATKNSTTTVGPGRAATTDVSCKKKQRVVGVNAVGEAGDLFGSSPVVILGEVSRPGKRRAQAGAFNFGMETGDLTAIARCKKGPRSRLKSRTITIPPAGMAVETESVSAKCPRGKRIVFGGFRGEQRPEANPDNPVVVPTAARREGARRWTVEGFNLSDGPDDAGELESLVYCGKAKRTEAHAETVTTDALETGSATARCPRGTKLRYGGFVASTTPNGAGLVTGLERTGGRTFRATHFVLSMTPLDLTAIAYCS